MSTRYIGLAIVLSVLLSLPLSAFWKKKPDPNPEPILVVVPDLPISDQTLDNSSNIINEDITKTLDPLPIANWMNMSFLEDLFDPTCKFLTNREEYFNSINSLGQYYLSLKPSAFYSNYNLNDHDFVLQTYGLSLRGAAMFKDAWSLGGRLAYSYSDLKYEAPFKHTSINSIYFGPSLAYLFEKAYLELMLMGVYNSYSIGDRDSSSSWSFDAQLAGGVDFKAPSIFGAHCVIQPNICFDYLLVLKDRPKDSEDAFCRKADFFRSCVVASFSKKFQRESKGFIIPTFSIGWALMLPITQYSLSEREAHYKKSNQAYLELGVVSIHKNGIILSLDGEAYLAKLYPAYIGSLKIEFTW